MSDLVFIQFLVLPERAYSTYWKPNGMNSLAIIRTVPYWLDASGRNFFPPENEHASSYMAF